MTERVFLRGFSLYFLSSILLVDKHADDDVSMWQKKRRDFDQNQLNNIIANFQSIADAGV